MSLILYSYFRSSAAYRVRIALNLKGLDYEIRPVHLVKNEQTADDYRARNPQGLVPTLVDEDRSIGQSIAILEYLEEIRPVPPLLPDEPAARARVRQIADAIACDIHPLNNLRVLKYLKNELGLDEEPRSRWYAHWIREGFVALEQLLAADGRSGDFCHGDRPGYADCFLIPQLYNAHRFKVPLDDFPTICRIEANCLALEPFRRAAPEAQPDAV
ncbi:MAG: maleylacetoacetate isomerase [Alphaproteobacteria bacterium]|nr:MAG: maleylacetoacetate isomerase [Alphaproteobacteria bacterium]